MAARPEFSASAFAEPAGLPAALFSKLSPGPGTPAAEVAANQRARIYGAMLELVGERGYDAVTVRELARVAGVSTRAFYDHFEGKEECFLRTYEAIVQRAAARVVAAQAGEQDWEERLRLGFRAFVREVEDKPEAARLALVEAFAAGPAALDGMRRGEQIFEAMVAEGFGRNPDGIEMSPLLVKGIVAGIGCAIRARLLGARGPVGNALADELLEWALSFHGEAAVELGELDLRDVSAPSNEIDGVEAETQSPSGGAHETDRDLILKATAKLAAAEGFWQLTVPRIRSAAGVSRRGFNAHFSGVEDCFLAALEHRTDDALDHVARQAADRNWPFGVHKAMTALCMQLADDPVLAKLAFVEVFASGLGGVRYREELIATKVRLFCSDPADEGPGSSQFAAEASMGAIWAILRHHVVTGQAQHLPRVSPTLSFLALVPATGDEAALDAIRSREALSVS